MDLETIRSFLRGVIGYRSLPYRVASNVITLAMALLKGGSAGLRVARLQTQNGPGVWVNLRGLEHPIFVRPGTEDIGSVLNNIFREEYGQFHKSLAPLTIIDAGAYIGDTSAYFMSRFKQARVVALEPNPESFEIAFRNLAKYEGRVCLLNAALCKEEGLVRISGATTGASISEIGTEVRAVSMQSLLRDFQILNVDILKMDIEGSELEILSSSASAWLPKVKALLLETHGADIERAVLPVVRGCGFSIRRFRNVWYCENMA